MCVNVRPYELIMHTASQDFTCCRVVEVSAYHLTMFHVPITAKITDTDMPPLSVLADSNFPFIRVSSSLQRHVSVLITSNILSWTTTVAKFAGFLPTKNHVARASYTLCVTAPVLRLGKIHHCLCSASSQTRHSTAIETPLARQVANSDLDSLQMFFSVA